MLCAKQYNGEHGCAVSVHAEGRNCNGARIYLPQIYPRCTNKGVLRATEPCT